MFKILSIDGGGIKGVFPASFLAQIEEKLQRKVADYFDLIVGTSTGGIIAIALGLGISAKEILKFYETQGPKIFKKKSNFLGFFRPDYNIEILERSLKEIFGDKKIGHSSKRLLIPTLLTDTGLPYVYKTAHHKEFHIDYKKTAVEAALSTSSAPTFFKSFKANSGFSFIDGGMWAKNPVLVALIESIAYLKKSVNLIKILSLGCTTNTLDFSELHSGGKYQWAFKVSGVFTSAQSWSAVNMTNILMNKKNFYRIDQITSGKNYTLDDINNIEILKSYGSMKVRENFTKLKRIFFNKPAKKFIPSHKLKS